MSRLLSVTVELEDVAGVHTIRTVLHDKTGQPVAMAVNSVSPEQAECQEMLNVFATEQMRQVVKHLHTSGIPHVSTPETPHAGSQSNRATQAEQESPSTTG
ncbi:hypothetical protein FDH02_gp13 [Pseudomonas phage VSW-3]|uniref:Uncharacterized protein n=1 Tax=Pseudomonas phage VSW-3 TaxID=1852562 RepID=A0A173GDF9_9CAUD|nr:hypothetical protein FDH02_gp13 [Pseudomonas phage VSW-3]ANH51089.1 hypothetical protein VSW3_13 [Pseudomonas phage VSW-3]